MTVSMVSVNIPFPGFYESVLSSELDRAEDAARDILRRLVEWAEHMGGWEAPVWAEARQLLGLGDPEAVPEGFEIRHDLVGFYACTDDEAEWEDEGHESVGFDGRPHFESIGECADWLRRQL